MIEIAREKRIYRNLECFNPDKGIPVKKNEYSIITAIGIGIKDVAFRCIRRESNLQNTPSQPETKKVKTKRWRKIEQAAS